MIEFLSLAGLARKLDIPLDRAKALTHRGIIVASAIGPRGPQFNTIHIPAWREAIDREAVRRAAGV